MKKFAVVVLNYNGRKILEETLSGLMEHVLTPIEIIVVDNGSVDGSKEYLENLKLKTKSLKIIFNDRNLGFTGGNNAGIKYALSSGADYIMLLNNDVLIKNDFLKPIFEFMEKNKDIGVVGPKIYFAPGHEFQQGRYQKNEQGKVIWYAGGVIDWDNVFTSHRGVDEVDVGQYDVAGETDFVTGCCLTARADIWSKIKFDDRYFLYYEDTDFCLKAVKIGYKIFYLPESKIWHLNAASSSCGGDLQDYFVTRNRLMFGFQWARRRTKFALFKESLCLFFSGRTWQKKAVIDFYRHRFGKGSWMEK